MTSITARLTVWYAFAVTVAVLAALVAGRFLLEREMRGGLDLLHEAEFREVLQQLDAEPGRLAPAELARQMAAHSAADEHVFFFQVHDQAGTVLFRSPNLGETVLPAREDAGESWTLELPGLGPVRGREFVAGPLHFQIASRLEQTELMLRQYNQIASALVAVVAVASLGLGYAISRVALRPIRDMAHTARRISVDHLNERIAVPPGRDELTGLAQLLNQTFDRLEKSFRQIARFSAEASHELKTPLTLIRLNTERLRERVARDPEATAEVDGLLEEVARMQQLIERLLFLAKAEGGALPLTRAEGDTRPFVQSVAEDALVLAEDVGARLVVGRNEGGHARFDQGLMRQVLLNLVGNAVAAMPAGGEVTLLSIHRGPVWRLEVLDEGPGVPEEQLEAIFERFARGPRHGSAGVSGNGLGLAICRSIVVLHGGTIRAFNRADRSGLQLVVEIPRPAGG